MNENDERRNQSGGMDSQNCDCEGNCCPPKRNNMLPKIIFTSILLAAIGVIAFKVVNKPAPAAVKESCCPSQSSTCSDTSKTAPCDSTKSGSCCPK